MSPHAAKQTAKENAARPSCRLGDFVDAMVLRVRLGFPARFTTETGSEYQERKGVSSYLLARVLTIRGRGRPLSRNQASRRLGGEFSTSRDVGRGKNESFSWWGSVLARVQ